MRQFLKYEFKNNWKQFLLSYVLIIASFLLLSIFIMILMNENVWLYYDINEWKR